MIFILVLNFLEKWPSLSLVEVCSQWMNSRSPLISSAGPNLLLGLIRWTILHPLIQNKREAREDSVYALLHLSILQTLADLKEMAAPVSSKTVVLLIVRVHETLKSSSGLQCDLGSSRELALDRLGQFLHCLTSVGGIHGKLNEVHTSVKKLEAVGGNNRLLQMYLKC